MKFFKLSKLKRLIILVATITAATLAIVLGSTFYVGKNSRKSIEYGGGAEYLFKVESTSSQASASEIATDVAQSIYERINPLGVNGAEASAEKSKDGTANIRVTYPGIKTKEEQKDVENLIKVQPQLVLTDVYGNPLFTENGKFNNLLSTDPKGFVGTPSNHTANALDFYKYETDVDGKIKKIDSRVPIASGGAKAVLHSDGTEIVQINLESDAAGIEWTKATTYVSSLPDGAKSIQAWLNPQVFVHEVQSFFSGGVNPDFSQVWSESGSLQALAHYAVGTESGKMLSNPLMTNVARAEDYLISSAMVSQPLSGREFIIQGNFNAESAQNLARKINYGISEYTLKTLYSRSVDASYGSSAFNKAIIAGIVVFSVIALILMVNYGLLGALSTISIALFIFMTLLMFTVMRGEYSPAAIAALIIGIGMSVDANIITFERLKSEMYSGASVGKAFATSNRKSFSTIFDSNITTMIVAIVLFYFGTRSIIGLSVTLIISIVFTLLIMLLFTRFTSTMLVKSGAFNDKKWLVGLKPKMDPAVQAKINKYDFIKNSKWFVLSSGLIMLAGIVMFAIFAAIHHSGVTGLVLSQDFTGGTAVTVLPTDGFSFTANEQNQIAEAIAKTGIPLSDITTSSSVISANSRSIVEPDVITSAVSGLHASISSIDTNAINISNTTTDVAHKLVMDAIWAVLIAMVAIIIYTLIRFKWTYSIAAIIALVHDAAIVIAVFAIARVEVSPIFIAAVLSVVGYSINDTIVTFDRLREKTKNHIGVMDKAAIVRLANEAIQDTLKRSLWTSFTTLISVVILMSFGNATKFEFNVAMLVGLVSGTYSSIFIATYLWTKLEMFRQKRVQVRVKKQFWKTKGVEEQTVQGINDYTI